MVLGIRPSRTVFAAVMIGLGLVGLIYGDFALVWQPVALKEPLLRASLAYFSAAIELLAGIGLLLRPSVRLASRVLFVYLLLWVLLLKVPELFLQPGVMESWGGFGEIAIILAGAWCLFAAHAGEWEKRHLKFLVGEPGVRSARLLLIAALPMIGLVHFVYAEGTASYVPDWLSYRLGWAYLTGSGSLLAAAGLLFGVVPRLAATLEAAMLWIITLLVWGRGVASLPTERVEWTAICISAAIATGTWLVADTYRDVPWLASGKTGRGICLD